MQKEIEWLLREKYNGEKTAEFLADYARLEAGEPLAYVIGYVPFLNTTIYLDSHPLIPRPETEYWTEQAMNTMRNLGTAPLNILDLCAGSGAIGIAVLKALPNTHVDFVEIDSTHHADISHSLHTNDIDESRVRIFGGDLFSEITLLPHSPRYDFILTNPPYIDPKLDRTEASVKQFEPHLALYGGESGLTHITRIITDARQFLSESGQLWIEHEPEHEETLQTLASRHHFSITIHADQYAYPRFSVLTMAQ